MFSKETAKASQELAKIFALLGKLKGYAHETQTDTFVFDNADAIKVLELQQIRQMLEMVAETWEAQ